MSSLEDEGVHFAPFTRFNPLSSVSKAQWGSIRDDSAGAIDSLVELLQGRLSTSVMERISRQHTGLFPAPKEITFT